VIGERGAHHPGAGSTARGIPPPSLRSGTAPRPPGPRPPPLGTRTSGGLSGRGSWVTEVTGRGDRRSKRGCPLDLSFYGRMAPADEWCWFGDSPADRSPAGTPPLLHSPGGGGGRRAGRGGEPANGRGGAAVAWERPAPPSSWDREIPDRRPRRPRRAGGRVARGIHAGLAPQGVCLCLSHRDLEQPKMPRGCDRTYYVPVRGASECCHPFRPKHF